MAFRNAATCPACNSAVAPDALFCTNCGTRLAEPSAPVTQKQAELEPEGKPSHLARCLNCKAVLGPEAISCTACGTRISEPEVTGPDVAVSENNFGTSQSEQTQPVPHASQASESQTSESKIADRIADNSAAPVVPNPGNSLKEASRADNSSPLMPSANQSAAAPAMAVMNSESTRTSSLAKQQSENISTKLGESSSAPKPGIFVILALVLIVAAATAILLTRPSRSKPAHVIILTPQRTSFTVEPNATIRLSIAVQGDNGTGLFWKIPESYGGTVQPAGVTIRGSQFLYHATYHAGGTPGDYHVVATSAANRDSSVTILVHVER
jgi:hypothetical protein